MSRQKFTYILAAFWLLSVNDVPPASSVHQNQVVRYEAKEVESLRVEPLDLEKDSLSLKWESVRSPHVTGFWPNGDGGPVSRGSAVIIDFNQPVTITSLRLEPRSDVWVYWPQAKRLVIMAKTSFAPSTTYTLSLIGHGRGGEDISRSTFSFVTGDETTAVRCQGEVLMYHINGRPKAGEITDNYVSWEAFTRELDSLTRAGCQFGTLDKAGQPGFVVITFDDGIWTQYPAAQILSSRGIKATFFITVNNLDKPRLGFLSSREVKEMVNMGMVVGSHLMDHLCLSTEIAGLPAEKRHELLEYQLGESQRQLQKLTGQPVEYLAYPFGCYDDTVAEAAASFYSGAWTTNRVYPLPSRLQMFGKKRVTVVNETKF